MIDIFGVNWDYPENELCPICGQPDSCGDCNHFQLSDKDVKQIKEFEEYVIVEFSGWIKLSPEKVNFVNIGSEEEKTITGTEWLKLSQDERGDYILENIIWAQRDAEDGEYNNIDASAFRENAEGICTPI